MRITTVTGKVIVIDPWLTGNPKTPPQYKNLDAIGKIDVILVTHAHGDHLGDAVALAKKNNVPVYAPAGLNQVLVTLGELPPELSIRSSKSGTVTPLGPDIKITQVHAEHSSELLWRNPATGKDETQPGGEPVGFIIELENGFKIYHMGDTGLFGDMRFIGSYYKPDLIMIPIGGPFRDGSEGRGLRDQGMAQAQIRPADPLRHDPAAQGHAAGIYRRAGQEPDQGDGDQSRRQADVLREGSARMATNNKKQILAADTMVKAGWDFIAKRDDVEARPYAIGMTTPALHAALRDLDGIALGGLTPFGEAELAAAARLQVVTRLGVGYDKVDVPALTARRIPLMVIGTANSVTVAEFAIYLMMTLAKRGSRMHSLVQQGRWSDKAADLPVDFFGKTLLIVGFGRIGTRVAKRCLAMEMTVQVYDPCRRRRDPRGRLRAGGRSRRRTAGRRFRHPPLPQEPRHGRPVRRGAPGAAAALGLSDQLRPRRHRRRGRLAPGAQRRQARRRRARRVRPRADPHRQSAARAARTWSRHRISPAAPSSRPSGRGVTAMRNILSVLDGNPIRENVVNPEVLD